MSDKEKKEVKRESEQIYYSRNEINMKWIRSSKLWYADSKLQYAREE